MNNDLMAHHTEEYKSVCTQLTELNDQREKLESRRQELRMILATLNHVAEQAKAPAAPPT